jgi:hypothetical protein
MFLVYKCKSLISAYACSLDPTIRLSSLPSVEDDNATVVTSNVTQSAHQLQQQPDICWVTHSHSPST